MKASKDTKEGLTMNNYGNTKELSQKVLEGMTVYSDMLGAKDESKKTQYNFVPGLGMSANSAVLEQQKEKLKEGVFQVLFTGGFSAGKSTMLNALMRRDILRVSINAETAIVTKIVFEKAEKIIVYMKENDSNTGRSLKKEMSIEDFFEEYRVDQDNADKFKMVDYAVLQLEQEGIGGNMVQLVDSPGTENSDADTLAAREFAKKADAVVHMINATQPFQQADKEYIASHYGGQHMENLFFVINRFDCVQENDIPELKKNVREQLSNVFTKQDGSFNEKLFNERVFYTNAYGALMARTGKKVKIMGMEVAIDEKNTGVPEFENALAKFLTDDGRDCKAFQSYLPRMAGMYLAANQEIDKIMSVYNMREDELIANKEKLEDNTNEYALLLEQIREACRSAVSGILEDARTEYGRCVNRISTDWDSYFTNTKVDFKFGQMMGLAFDKVTGIFSKDEAAKQLKMEKRMKPLSDAVNGYISPELKKLGPSLEISVKKRMKTLENQLNLLTQKLKNMDSPLSYDDITRNLMSAFHMDTSEMIGDAKVDANLFQIILGAIALDPETIGKGVSGSSSNSSVIIATIIKSITEFIALYVVAWPIGIAMLVARLVQMIKEGNATRKSTAQQVLKGMRDSTINALKMNEKNFIMELENQLSVITRGGVTMTDSIQLQVDDYAKQLDDALADLSSNTAAAAIEKQRTNNIQVTLLNTLKKLYRLLNGRELTEDMIKELAISE